MQIFPPGIFFQMEILPINLNGFTAKFHLKFTSKNSTWKKNPAGIYTNHWVTHPTTNHDLVA